MRVHSLTLSCTPESVWCDSRAFSWLAPLQPLCLGREPKAKVVTLLVLGRATSNSDSQDSPWLGFGGSHHLPLYNIICASSQGPHQNNILSRDSQMGVLKFSKLGLPQLWGPIILCVDLRLRWGLTQSCSPLWKFSNHMLHATCVQRNRVNSRFLMVRNQIVNLTPDSSFDHNLCFRCPNGSCEPTLNIYVSIDFQWYKELLKTLSFDFWNRSLNIWESTGTPTDALPSHGGETPSEGLTKSSCGIETW